MYLKLCVIKTKINRKDNEREWKNKNDQTYTCNKSPPPLDNMYYSHNDALHSCTLKPRIPHVGLSSHVV